MQIGLAMLFHMSTESFSIKVLKYHHKILTWRLWPRRCSKCPPSESTSLLVTHNFIRHQRQQK